ncbi:HET-domain-containing protein [Apiospora rasikravindrae]|uniref:HET-domain-containing protein n=1 Tax=Apiospora rasikravindrae TaxID=990691 RepID=A0ABR1SQT8_9PEZI
MRCIDTILKQVVQKTACASFKPYAILSHTWDNAEITFHDFAEAGLNGCRDKAGYAKLNGAIDLAREQKFRYIWVDTCCIDKTSSSELSEAINSMFEWYRNAEACYVYLSDYSSSHDYNPKGPFVLGQSRWFRRSWTLQELIAPNHVAFYSREWKSIGTKAELCQKIADITGISAGVLMEPDGYKVASTAQRMSWAASREATRGEDHAYSLFGIFEINMTPLYGEGAERAFRRLQEEIIRTSTDDSILAWLPSEEASGGLLAECPGSLAQLLHANRRGRAFRVEMGLGARSLLHDAAGRYVGDFRGPLGIKVEALYPGKPGRLALCQRQARAPQLVPVNSSASLAKLERCKICILESSAILEGRGRGLKTKSGLPRMWIRTVAEPLQIVEVGPREVYNWDLSIFEASTRASNVLRRRVLVLSDRHHPDVRHVVVAFIQVAGGGVQANLITYPVPSARSVDEVVGAAMAANCSELRDADMSKTVHTARGESQIKVKMQHGLRLGEEIFTVDIERWGALKKKSSHKH